MYVGFSENGTRDSSRPIDFSEFKDLIDVNVRTEDKHWELSYKVPYKLIEKYLSDFNVSEQKFITANFYKCGDDTLCPHYEVWHNIDVNFVEKPDFHVVDYFGKIFL